MRISIVFFFFEFICAVLPNQTKYGSFNTIEVYYSLCKILCS